jgi:HD-GYP domain-containing protein (c-di-GMP phosphodiesterase class II)
MHDIGKLAVPNKILEKPGPLTADEYFIMKRHTYLTRIMTSFTEGFSDISAWAWMHHENLDGTGYPCGITGEEMPFESQILAVLDKYQALTEDRPYRGSLSHVKALSILRDLAKHGKINGAIVEDVDSVFSNDE